MWLNKNDYEAPVTSAVSVEKNCVSSRILTRSVTDTADAST